MTARSGCEVSNAFGCSSHRSKRLWGLSGKGLLSTLVSCREQAGHMVGNQEVKGHQVGEEESGCTPLQVEPGLTWELCTGASPFPYSVSTP